MDTTPVNPLVIEANIIEALQTIFDPEIPVSIWEIGLIYGIKVDPSGTVGVRMTLTSPNCPSAAELPQEVERKVRAIGGVTAATVEVVFDPPLAAIDDVGGGQTTAEHAVARTLRRRLTPCDRRARSAATCAATA